MTQVVQTIPIFKNNKPYDIDVPTLNGGGRIVPPGHYIMGDFFFDTFKQTRQLTLMPGDHKVDPKLLVCVIHNKDRVKLEELTASPNVDLTSEMIDQLNHDYTDPNPSTDETKQMRPEDAFRTAVNDLAHNVSLPEFSELDTIPADKLKKIAAHFGVPLNISRGRMLEEIKKQYPRV